MITGFFCFPIAYTPSAASFSEMSSAIAPKYPPNRSKDCAIRGKYSAMFCIYLEYERFLGGVASEDFAIREKCGAIIVTTRFKAARYRSSSALPRQLIPTSKAFFSTGCLIFPKTELNWVPFAHY